ncbi:hypothetical protein BJF78_33625 [Pseudonocardia sp. CNS-139]|nr:hypothetical protein BJF78_33625 [Pseudonocardia sp. CNS-139]
MGVAEALPGLRGLLRTVRTPEFAGTVFHEVEARSALNRVPAASAMPFRWTVNPYRGCSHACVYCLHGATRVLLPDGATRPIADLRPGDAVVGTEAAGSDVGGGRRRYVRTTVLAHWSTAKPAFRVRLAGGTELVTSGEHRFLSDAGWRHVAPGWCRAGRRPHLRPGTALLGPGRAGTSGPVRHREHPPAYRQGYLCGLVRGDTAVVLDRVFPSAHLELEALGRAHHFLADAAHLQDPARALAYAGGAEPGRIPRPSPAGRIGDVVRWPERRGGGVVGRVPRRPGRRVRLPGGRRAHRRARGPPGHRPGGGRDAPARVPVRARPHAHGRRGAPARRPGAAGAVPARRGPGGRRPPPAGRHAGHRRSRPARRLRRAARHHAPDVRHHHRNG